MVSAAPSAARAAALAWPRPREEAVTRATLPASPRSMPDGLASGVEDRQPVVDEVEGARAVIGGDDDVLDTRAEPAGQVDAGLDRKCLAGAQRVAVAMHQVGILVFLATDPVAGTVHEERPVAALLDAAPGRR